MLHHTVGKRVKCGNTFSVFKGFPKRNVPILYTDFTAL